MIWILSFLVLALGWLAIKSNQKIDLLNYQIELLQKSISESESYTHLIEDDVRDLNKRVRECEELIFDFKRGVF